MPTTIARIIADIAVTKTGTVNVLTCTLGVTESPGPIVWSAGNGSSKRIFTGTRWMTFTKLPVAFSGGNKLNCRAAAGLHTVHVRAEFPSAQRVNRHERGLARVHFFQLRFLEIGHDPHIRRHKRHDLLAGLQIIADFNLLSRHAPVAWRKDFRVGQIQLCRSDVGLPA